MFLSAYFSFAPGSLPTVPLFLLAYITGVYLAEREARDIEGEARDTSAEREARGRETFHSRILRSAQ